jgi:pteridine reductase
MQTGLGLEVAFTLDWRSEINPDHTQGMNNKTAIITGAARRIGEAITRELHNAGMDIVLHFNTSREAVEKLALDLNRLRPDSAYTLQADLLNRDTYTGLINQAYAINRRLDVLINNASVFFPTPLQNLGFDQWDEMMNINLRAPFFLAQAAAGYLKMVNGSVINLTDIHAERPLLKHAVYSISKAALVILTQSLAKELAPDVRVNAISPGAIFWSEYVNEDEKAGIINKTLLKKQGTGTDIAKAARYLVFDADYITGQVLVIDGGRSLYS